MERWLHSLHPRRLRFYFYSRQIRTFSCFDCIRPCHSVSNNKSEQYEAHTRARMLLSLSPCASLFMCIFDFIMISKQTRAREWNVDVGVTANRKEAKFVPYFSDLRVQLHEKSNGDCFSCCMRNVAMMIIMILSYYGIGTLTCLFANCNNYAPFHYNLLKCQPN